MSGAQQIGLFRRARVSSVERIDTEAGVGQSTDLSQTAETVRLLDLVVAGAHPSLHQFALDLLFRLSRLCCRGLE